MAAVSVTPVWAVQRLFCAERRPAWAEIASGWAGDGRVLGGDSRRAGVGLRTTPAGGVYLRCSCVFGSRSACGALSKPRIITS